MKSFRKLVRQRPGYEVKKDSPIFLAGTYSVYGAYGKGKYNKDSYYVRKG